MVADTARASSRPGLDATPVGLHQEEQERAGEGGEAVERAAGGVAALLRVRLHERLVDLPHQDTEAGPHLGQRASAGGHGVHVGGQVGIADRLGDLGLEMTDRGQHRRFRLREARAAVGGVFDRGDGDQPVLLDAAGELGEQVEPPLRIERAIDRAIGDVHRVNDAQTRREGDREGAQHEQAELEADGAQARLRVGGSERRVETAARDAFPFVDMPGRMSLLPHRDRALPLDDARDRWTLLDGLLHPLGPAGGRRGHEADGKDHEHERLPLMPVCPGLRCDLRPATRGGKGRDVTLSCGDTAS